MKGTLAAIIELLLIFLLLAVVAVLLLAYLRGADLIEMVRGLLTRIANPPAPQLSPDSERYFELKNLSCRTLSGDFLIVLEDSTTTDLQGLRNSTPDESVAAEAILSKYPFKQIMKIYSKGDRMKRVVADANGERTTIWKEGRIYECAGNCNMRLMDGLESDAYYGMLADMRSSCAYFGNTNMPAQVDIDSLLLIERRGPLEISGFRCQDFLIHGNATYAQSLLSSSNLALSEDQKAVLWLLSHLSGPAEECLDEGTGIVVLRTLSLDLTRSYLFSYDPGGHMHVDQKTELLYFTDNVPESFLGLPQ